ncbi:peptidase [Herminiimonas sp. KBW02]|uniref:PepSY-associated TM helix domain-containing protein n=1 Tax=Herminiimonas sp. KBW02 TaxID=2153363 RepID=UPI000F59A35C|nr:PepSY-associated TM helix domain-containing protein [Herminiimonas sp. KBW02]RQO36999.1 peptidase [Herminiimonas sp. KBW02]
MKEGFRQCMAWLHTWTGLVVGWVLFFVFVTGTAGYFTYEIDRWMRPELPLVTSADVAPQDALAKAQAYLEQHAAGAESWTISLPGDRSQPNLGVSWQPKRAEGEGGGRNRGKRVTLDAHSGEAVDAEKVRATGGGHLLYRMHYQLHYISYDVAIRLVGICTMLMFLAILTGVVTHKKIFKDFFTFRPAKGQRSWLDAHNIISVMALPFFVMITYSGLVFFMFNYMPLGVTAIYGAEKEGRDQFFKELYPQRNNAKKGPVVPATLTPLAPLLVAAEKEWGAGQVQRFNISRPYDARSEVTVARRSGGDIGNTPALRFNGVSGAKVEAEAPESGSRAFQSVILGLHEGRFAGPLLRWIYLISGLLGASMIATGLVLWTVKRKVKQDKLIKAGQRREFGFRLVECLNIGTIAGLSTAVAVYFWANRLIPADFAGRREWEVHAMFIAWGLALLYPAFRPALRAWVEELSLAAAAFLLLPLLNAVTTERHLGVTLPAGDWVLAGFDLTMLALGVFFALAARKVQRKLKSQPAQVRPARTASAAAGLENAI